MRDQKDNSGNDETRLSETQLSDDPPDETRLTGKPLADTQLTEEPSTADADKNAETQLSDATEILDETERSAIEAFDATHRGETQALPGTQRSDPPDAEGENKPLPEGFLVKDRFVIDRVLGRGGMGIVYRALDRVSEQYDRDPYVALKMLSDEFQRDERMVAALHSESRKAQTLAHPNIATVYDFDRDGDLVYIHMEELEGQPLDDFIADHPDGLPRERVAPIVRGICLGLAYAHNTNIVHSDFKPSNVFLDSHDNPKILDFGIARAAPVKETQMLASDVTKVEGAELHALTPSYAASEMFSGEDPDPSDDVYALAITVYELLTGHHPYHKTPAPTAQAEGLKLVPISGLKRREWRAISRGLAFDRAERQQNAAEFLREFEGPGKIRLVAGAAIVLAIALAGYFTFVQIQEQARIAPDVAFEDLSGDLQQEITRLLLEGQEFQRFGDDYGALLQYKAAYDLHPRNPQATVLLVSLLEGFTNRVIAEDSDIGRSSLKQNLDRIMDTDGFLGTHERLVNLQERLEP